MVRNTFLLRIRVWLNKLGLVKPKPVDYDAFAARMCLETSMACYYKSKVGDVAGFFFPDLPYVDGDGIKKVCELLTVHVNVKTKKMTKATFDDEEITSRQVAAILFYYNLSANHVKIHSNSMANWGLNSEESAKGVNSFLYQNSIVTPQVCISCLLFVVANSRELNSLCSPTGNVQSLRIHRIQGLHPGMDQWRIPLGPVDEGRLGANRDAGS